MARCAVVQYSDERVINMIVAEIGITIPQDGCFLVDVDNFPYADIGWFYDPVMVDFYPPPVPPPDPVDPIDPPVEPV